MSTNSNFCDNFDCGIYLSTTDAIGFLNPLYFEYTIEDGLWFSSDTTSSFQGFLEYYQGYGFHGSPLMFPDNVWTLQPGVQYKLYSPSYNIFSHPGLPPIELQPGVVTNFMLSIPPNFRGGVLADDSEGGTLFTFLPEDQYCLTDEQYNCSVGQYISVSNDGGETWHDENPLTNQNFGLAYGYLDDTINELGDDNPAYTHNIPFTYFLEDVCADCETKMRIFIIDMSSAS